MPEIRKLLQGFQRFRVKSFEPNRELFNRLAMQGQTPRTLLIGCSDSRVDPAILTDSDPGEIFVVRNVANLVPPFETGGRYHGTSAALEFAVCNLKVHSVVILGHSHCGGISALLDGYGENDEGEGYIAPWVRIAAEARNEVLERWPDASREFKQRACERAGVRVSLRNLLTFPFVRQRVDAGELNVYGWYYDLENGELLQYDPEKDRFYDLYFGPAPAGT
ncbi:MAG: carbonic anhydrase [Candidatus Competibacteraceae bacterium]|uniref:Carbonic anhydrase n=1 Tax=Candidatus Contendobacter odensis Run_B_J11 TaxID=1400861 RepID=A0A7U7G9B9_9GAMM|nr:carbonic anhydrase [Candidatus Contendobacter odensis]MBK8533935.1 carbonic anhydrase [Candidatus Competibacteraceae bacterium]MBK8751209.1 carbonic anhydrase [Candidatus Competibacteraceae bacterium]CDH44297.1 Carbonic anhydrase [Candidatus Contendobacter odensis Run_B_J11]